jgi:dUTP pyrophosphatase
MTHYLYIWTSNNELKEHYITASVKHNIQIETNYPNAGFDLFCPKSYDLSSNEIFCLDTEIVCSMVNSKNKNKSYYLYPRSSIIKTPLRLANSVGIIDSGYRGNIKAMFDIKNNYNVEKMSRLCQICAPNLDKFYVKVVDNLEDLGITERGSGGFGSTGK